MLHKNGSCDWLSPVVGWSFVKLAGIVSFWSLALRRSESMDVDKLFPLLPHTAELRFPCRAASRSWARKKMQYQCLKVSTSIPFMNPIHRSFWVYIHSRSCFWVCMLEQLICQPVWMFSTKNKLAAIVNKQPTHTGNKISEAGKHWHV